MKSLKLILVTIFISLTSVSLAHAKMTNVPNILSAPIVFFDEGGNPLIDGDYFITISLKDESQNTLYQEEQQISVSNHVAPIIIGQGYAVGSDLTSPAGGLSKEIFDVMGDVSVEIQIEGQQSTQEVAILTSQPYAFISDSALSVADGSINTYSIKDGSITEADLEPSFVDSLKNASFVDQDGQTITAKSISVTSDIGLNNSGASTIQSVLQDLDSAITSIKALNISGVESKLDSHITDAENTYVKLSGSTMTGDLNMNGNDVSNVGTVDGIDVSALNSSVNDHESRISSLEDPDQSMANLEITGIPTGDPTPGTLYKNNLVFAWAIINAIDTITPPNLANSFNISSVIKNPNSLGGNGSHNCNYKLTFLTPASSASSYVITATLVDPIGDNTALIREVNKNYVTVGVVNADANSIDCGAYEQTSNIHVTVIGF